MSKITVETCPIKGLKIITPSVFGDERGYFMETYNYNDFKEVGIDMENSSRTTSPPLKKAYSEASISRSTTPRTNSSA